MFKIMIDGPRNIDGQPSVEVEVPTTPRIGERLAHEPSGIEGDVRDVTYWWSEDGEFMIRVAVR